MTHRLFALAGGLAVVVGLVAAGVPVRAEIIEQVLVRVNGEIVSKTDFEQRQINVLRTRPELANVSPTILEVVDELLLIQRGRELDYALGDEQFKRIVEDIKKSNNITDEAQFQAELK